MEQDAPITGFYAPVHRALTEPILLGGAPRAVAIVNGTSWLRRLAWDFASGSLAARSG